MPAPPSHTGLTSFVEVSRSRSVSPALQSMRLLDSGPNSSRFRNARRSPLFYFGTVIGVAVALIWALHGARSPRNHVHRWHKGLHDFKGPILVTDSIPCLDPTETAAVDRSAFGSQADAFDGPLPQPFAGSYEALGLNQTWITAGERYGPYGRPSDAQDPPSRSVDWSNVNWADLQSTCAWTNRHRFREHVHRINSRYRFKLPTQEDSSETKARFHKLPPRPKQGQGRTAIILRAWSTFVWGDEDMWSLRSLITETALTSGGEYSVFILMDVKKEHTKVQTNIWEDEKFYSYLLDTLIPGEFRDIGVLFNLELLELWYPKVGEHRPEYQMFQPLQLFAHHFPEFDYFWTMEMDVRFTGHVGTSLSALQAFARNEPRKQARQRMSHYFLSGIQGSYANFKESINEVLDGGDAYYDGVRIPDVPEPIGPRSPYKEPNEDNFEWGVGEEADFITFSPCNNVTVHKKWLYRDYINNFKLGVKTPGRIICPVTTSRTSWNLLNQVHNHQIEQGLRIPTESTMGSFALWHGLKMSLPPLPMYSRQDHRHEIEDVSRYINGGKPSREHDGMAWGEFVYEKSGEEFKQHTPITNFTPTYRYETPYPQNIWEFWLKERLLQGEDHNHDELPSIIVKNGRIYLPNTMLHPVKTNTIDPKNNEPP